MFLSACVLGLALAADAFAVSLSQGVVARERPHATALMLGGAFGLAQGVMPLVGWSAGLVMTAAIAAYDHWVAFAVLAAIGAKLIWEGWSNTGEAAKRVSGWGVVALALATSLDAAGAGLALDALEIGPLMAALVIGLITAAACAGGVYLGRAAGARLGRAAEFAGGAALIAIGVKILWDHGALS
ncbi:MAG TPA: manganese efflux pump [Vitreimonas sp.]|uniref:manganese efflux pump MntP n=1 Tax=Vitreimonas sp. TaxID=3069702 RepID=UPI002D42ED61|nr:manganese efflux pump [Vitreimonas sp.]HYD89840.1 manganese efflux pump [Vitreimonas sp.]